MGKLFFKVITINFTVILIFFGILNNVTSNQFEKYLVNQKEEALITQARVIENEYAKIINEGVIDYEKIQFEINALDRYLNTKISVINRDGQVLASSESYQDIPVQNYFTSEDIEKIYEGKIIIKKNIFNSDGMKFMVVGHPIRFFEKTHFVILMNASIPELEKTINGINEISFYALWIIGMIVLAVNFYMIRSLTKNMQEINEAIKLISVGDFEKKIDLDKDDEIGELARSFNSMTRDLKKFEDMRETFISNISHDIRSPLTSINGFIQAIKDGTIPKEDQDRYLGLVLDESKRLIKMTNDILDLSKIQTGGMKYTMEFFDLNGVVLNSLENLETRINDKKININIRLEEGMPNAYGDYQKIQRVVYNLMDNAIKFSSNEGEIKILTFTDKQNIVFKIQNNGEIISLEDLPKIFTRFTKLDESRGKDKLGSGLGLSIAKEILRAHKQDIYVESSEETGVIFTFTLGTEVVKNN